jgi:hypothetical protein
MLTLTVDVAGAQALCASAQRQLPYATSRAINQVANDVRDTMRDELLMRFMVRKRTFIQKSIGVTKYSDKRDPVIAAVVSTGHPSGKDVLGKFEEGTTKTALDPLHPIAKPVEVRRTPQATIDQRWYLHNLGLVPVRTTIGTRAPKWHKTGSGKVQIKGARRTFILGGPMSSSPNTFWGVYQRTSKKKIRLLWALTQKQRVEPRLGFRGTALAVVEARWPDAFARFFEQALATAR